MVDGFDPSQYEDITGMTPPHRHGPYLFDDSLLEEEVESVTEKPTTADVPPPRRSARQRSAPAKPAVSMLRYVMMLMTHCAAAPWMPHGEFYRLFHVQSHFCGADQ